MFGTPLFLTPRRAARLAVRSYQDGYRLFGLPGRVLALLEQTEQLVARADALVARIEATDRRAAAAVADAETVVGDAETVVGEAASVVSVTATVVARAQQLTDQAATLLAAAEPALVRLLPLLRRLAASLTEDDQTAILRLVSDLPTIVAKLDRDIMPVLDTLGTVAPDLRELLDASKDLNEMLGGLPGLGRIKRRLDSEQADPDTAREYLADEQPSTAPDRGADDQR